MTTKKLMALTALALSFVMNPLSMGLTHAITNQQMSTSIQCQNSDCIARIAYNNTYYSVEYRFSNVKSISNHLSSSGLLIVSLLNGDKIYYKRNDNLLSDEFLIRIDQEAAENLLGKTSNASLTTLDACQQAFAFSTHQESCISLVENFKQSKNYALSVVEACGKTLSFDNSKMECLTYALGHSTPITPETIYACKSESFDNSILRCIRK